MDDIDMDLDLGDPLEDPGPEAELDVIDFSEPQQAQLEVNEETASLTNAEPVEDKIHIRGLDDLTTDDIKAYALAHFPESEPRIEWIDDTSANLQYPSASYAVSALTHLSSTSSTSVSPLNPLKLRAAKPHPTLPEVALNLRQAISTDRKRPRAHESSRFYLLHPEHDPRERRRRERGSDGEYSRLRYGDKEHHRRRRGDERNGFSASMYDDNDDDDAGKSDVRPSRLSRRSSGSRGRDRDRDRSASPSRFRTQRRTDKGNERRRRTPPPSYLSDDPDPVPSGNMGKELFPNGTNNRRTGKELFPNKVAAGMLKADLFSHQTKSDREDVSSETADLFASRMNVPFVDGAVSGLDQDHFPLRSDKMGGRVSDDWTQNDGLQIRDGVMENGSGLSIRGQGKEKGLSIKGTGGISIKGTAAQQAASKAAAEQRVKELFPQKIGNKGKELFPQRSRHRAEDMF